MIMQQATLRSQQIMKEFIDKLPPTYYNAVLNFRFENFLRSNSMFKANEMIVAELLDSLSVSFMSPESIIVDQNDENNKDIYILSEGIIEIQKRMDQRRKRHICFLQKDNMFNEPSALFEISPNLIFQSESYCTVGKIERPKFASILNKYPEIKQSLEDNILDNPYDIERNFFVTTCTKKIPYFKGVSEKSMKLLYYQSEQSFMEMDQLLFERGDQCYYIYIIISGEINISIDFGCVSCMTVDRLGRGSVVGYNNVLIANEWKYKALVVSKQSTNIIKIPRLSIDKLIEKE